VVTGPRPAPTGHEAEAVVLAVPATPAARLLLPHAPAAARLLGEVEYASMAVVTLAVERAGLGDLPGSGFLVPPVDGRRIKASTFSSAKWAWVDALRDDVVFLRASVGRAREEADLQRPDDELVALAVEEVGLALGRPLTPVVDAHVQRWGGGLPQYAVGHLDRVAAVRAEAEALPGLGLAGAAYDGVGIPACIGSGRAAAARVATRLRAGAGVGGE
jgi:oxygen-dependent protoporphyrinogen oxidase